MAQVQLSSMAAKKRMEGNKLNVTGMTVNRLYELCRVLLAEGKGDLGILISDDDEGNGFHHCFYDFTEDVKENALNGFHGCLSDDVTKHPDHYIILG